MRRLVSRSALAVVAALVTAACAATTTSTPAHVGVRAYVEALRADDPRAAYGLLAEDVRRDLTFEAFAADWREAADERAWQLLALDEALAGRPFANERASVDIDDRASLGLAREAGGWKLERPLIAEHNATRPRDVVRLLAAAVDRRDLEAILDLLSSRRRDGMHAQLAGFLAGLRKHASAAIDQQGDERAELRWEHDGVLYRLVIVLEDNNWVIDDLHIQRAAREDSVDEDLQ